MAKSTWSVAVCCIEPGDGRSRRFTDILSVRGVRGIAISVDRTICRPYETGGANRNPPGKKRNMKRRASLTLAAVAGFAISLVALEQHACARENPLLDWEFWKAATVEDVIAAIAEGADIHARLNDGWTPFHMAALKNDNPDVIRLLMDRGANVHARDETGRTPLHAAAHENGNPDVVGLLMDRGANVHVRDGDGATPLHVAGINENPDMAGHLMDWGADIHARDGDGKTPLHWAAAFGQNPDVAGLLLDRGANGSARDESGKTPFDYAQENGRIKNSKVYRRLKESQHR